ncbi:MAG: hypothetical protein INR62_00440 [Rhodospirillales bacterium]|nr:hypothetical protein [Acetobacter sp.]
MTTAQIVPAQADNRAVSTAESGSPAPLTVQQVLTHVALIQQIMSAAMKEGEHFGRIPGCGDKPTLLKPGAEKLCLLFRLAPAYDVEERQHERGHREYRVTTTLTSIVSGVLIGQGVGSCTTLENKYRFRAGAAEVTDRPVPRVYWETRQDDPAKAQELLGGKGFTVKKVDGQGWMVAKGGEKVETDNPADHYNTVLKMAKKRALVDAVLTTTAASDIFTQDLDELNASLATLTPPPPAQIGPVKSAAAPVPTPAQTTPPPAAASAAQSEAVDFRQTQIHFGKNRGMTLADLTPQQIHWYETEWLPKRETNGVSGDGDRTLIAGLKAYRQWREAEKATQQAPPARRARGKRGSPAPVPAELAA